MVEWCARPWTDREWVRCYPLSRLMAIPARSSICCHHAWPPAGSQEDMRGCRRREECGTLEDHIRKLGHDASFPCATGEPGSPWPRPGWRTAGPAVLLGTCAKEGGLHDRDRRVSQWGFRLAGPYDAAGRG